MKKKKITSQRDFEMKLKMWGIVIPVITTLITSLTAIFIAVYPGKSNKEPQTTSPSTVGSQTTSPSPIKHLAPFILKKNYQIPSMEQSKLKGLSARIDTLGNRYIQTKNSIERKKLDVELTGLADTEASIMRKYDPNYESRWQKVTVSHSYLRSPIMILFIIILVVLVYFSRHFTIRFLTKKYDIEHDSQLVDQQPPGS